MAIEVSDTVELHGEPVSSEEPIKGAHAQDLLKRINANEELIKDDKATGAGSKTVSTGHHHDGVGSGRGIMRMCCGYFSIVDSGNAIPLSHTPSVAGGIGESIANGGSGYPASSTPNALNYVMGKAYVSPGIESIRVEVCMKVESASEDPEIRVRNLTDTTSYSLPAAVNRAGFYASPWIKISNTSAPVWYGEAEDTQKITVPVRRIDSTRGDVREIELDIEIRDQAGTTQFSLYDAFAYEYVDQPATSNDTT